MGQKLRAQSGQDSHYSQQECTCAEAPQIVALIRPYLFTGASCLHAKGQFPLWQCAGSKPLGTLSSQGTVHSHQLAYWIFCRIICPSRLSNLLLLSLTHAKSRLQGLHLSL